MASEEELKVARKNDLNNLQSECEILKLRKTNLLENIANQDKILEEKLRAGKINQQVKKEILFYWDCDVTKDIENVNKKWDTKILGMTKAYEKYKRFLETEKVRHIPFNQTSPPPDTAVNDTNENVESTSNKTCHSREQTLHVQTAHWKINKIQKNWDHQPMKHREKRYNLRSSTYQNDTIPNSRYRYYQKDQNFV